MNDQSPAPLTWDIFCRVIDNFGDAGVCWRLAADLVTRGAHVRLYIDQPDILPKLIGSSSAAHLVEVQPWPGDHQRFSGQQIADVVIEAFACDIPSAYLDGMSQVKKPIAWINLEYLSAETWVESHHGIPSPHPRFPLTKHFYFPGFTTRTGGLLREPELTALLQSCHVRQESHLSEPLKIFLFSYEQPAIQRWLETIKNGNRSTRLCVAPCTAWPKINDWLHDQSDLKNLNVEALKFVAQHEFDALLAQFDLLFVRGEDSFVRAQWAGMPLVWHIYPQKEDCHLIKLKAFYDRYLYLGILSAEQCSIVWDFVLSWNTGHLQASSDMLAKLWPQVVAMLPVLRENAQAWRKQLLVQPDLVTQLRDFVRHLVKS